MVGTQDLTPLSGASNIAGAPGAQGCLPRTSGRDQEGPPSPSPHHPETLLSCPLEVCSSMTCMEKPAEPFSLMLATVVSLLLSPSCGFSPVSLLTQCGFHTSLPTRDQRGMMGTISHGHGAASHGTHKRDNKCHAKFQLLALVFAV